MEHDVTLIATIAGGFALAAVFGYVACRLGLPSLVGYLVAGVALGPFTPGFTADAAIAGQLAEIGVMLLMFGVGLHFSLDDLLAVRRLAVPGAIGQIAIATAIGAAMATLWGWSLGAGLVLGLSLSVASTVVLLKALEERNAVTTPNGRIAVGWLVVEDLAMVIALAVLPAVAGAAGGGAGAHAAAGSGALANLGITLVKAASFVALILLIGPRLVPWLLRQVARTGSRELFTLSVLAVALGIAFASASIFGVSFALGAFFAGMVLNESELSHKAGMNSLPLQDAFAVLFFISVGMLFDPWVLVRAPLMVGAVLFLVLVGKSVVALGIVLALGYPLTTALVVSAALAQIGEFSFILAGLGVSYELLPAEGLSLVLAAALLSITMNPFVFLAADRASRRVKSSGELTRRFEETRQAAFARLRHDLDAARERALAKAAAHKTFTPEELARSFPPFAGLTPEQREVLILHFHSRTAEPGERIIRAGEEADAVYFLSEGEVEVAVGRQRIKLAPGDVFGEMALFSGLPRSADVTALDYCKLAVLSLRDFRRFLDRYPDLREHFTRLAEQRSAMNRELLEESAEGEEVE